MSDPETKKEMENLNLNKMAGEMPDVSEMLTSFFTGGAPKKEEQPKPKIQSKQSNKKRN